MRKGINIKVEKYLQKVEEKNRRETTMSGHDKYAKVIDDSYLQRESTLRL